MCGMHCEATQKRLLCEKDLTFEKAQNIAVSMETAARDAAEIQQKSVECATNKMSLNRNEGKKCYRCGNTSHEPDECWFKDKECNNCGKLGHIARVCRASKQQKKDKIQKNKKPQKGKYSKVHKMKESSSDENASDSSVSDLSCLQLHSVNETDDRRIIWITPQVAGVKLKMELDTGSALTVISVHDYKRLFSHLPLKRTKLLLKTYTGQKVRPKGKIKVSVTYRDKTQQLNLYVLKNGGPPLLGREWLRKIQLDWSTIKALFVSARENSEATPPRLSQILVDSEEVFAKGLGTLKGMTAKMRI